MLCKSNLIASIRLKTFVTATFRLTTVSKFDEKFNILKSEFVNKRFINLLHFTLVYTFLIQQNTLTYCETTKLFFEIYEIYMRDLELIIKL